MTDKKIKILFWLAVAVLSCIGTWMLRPDREIKPIRIGSLSYNRDFNDMNAAHLKAAKAIGLEPFENRAEAAKARRKVVEIKSNKYYDVRQLDYSAPYLVPEAADLLDEIGERFRERLEELNAPLYKLQITSVTRTREDIQNLRKVNINASANSVHVYATTVDISWSKFTKVSKRDKRELTPDQLKQVLGLVLRELKQEGRCYVKHERQQACFHITARPTDS